MQKLTQVWLIEESRKGEHRTILIPEHAGALIQAGFPVTVERSAKRVYSDAEYEACGCTMVPAGTWPKAPEDALIVGLKELSEDDDFPLTHCHFYAAHSFDGETGSGKLLRRFDRGGGILYAFETLLDSCGHQIGAMGAGYAAGMIGAMQALTVWSQKKNGKTPPFVLPDSFDSVDDLIKYLSALDLSELRRSTKSLVIAPNGNVGRGVRNILDALEIPHSGWTRKETADAANRVDELLGQYEVVWNCISLDNIAPDTKTPILLTLDALNAYPQDKKRLSVISDISCYPTHPKNTLPIYSRITSLNDPTLRVGGIDIIAIDHLPTVLSKVCSDILSGDLQASMTQLLVLGDAVPKTPWPFAVERFKKAPRDK